MNCDEFIDIYWNNYILIEKEFTKTLKYVTLSEENYSTYSVEYQKLILQIGSEVDVILKDFCKYLVTSFNKDKMINYSECIVSKYKDLFQQDVILISTNEVLNPWKAMPTLLEKNQKKGEINWWKAYNKVKHERNKINEIDNVKKESYKFANLKYTLLALSALYQILLDYYLLISKYENHRLKIPLPGSRLFKLTGTDWNTVDFVFDYSFYINEDMHLCMESSSFQY